MNQKQRKRRKNAVKAHQKDRVSEFNPAHEETRQKRLTFRQASRARKKKKNKIRSIQKLVKADVLTEERGEELIRKIEEEGK